MKVQVHSSLVLPPLEYNQDQAPLMNQGSLCPFKTPCERLCSFRLVLEGEQVKRYQGRQLEKFLANNFALSDAEDNTSGSLNRGGIADFNF